MYIGETGRCLAERSNEHINGMMNGDKETFIIKHWALKHPDLKIPPRVEFKVVKNHRDCMTRLIHEAVLIDKEGSMNSKSEWRKNSRPRLMIEKSEWEKKKEYKQVIEEEREEEERIEEIIRLIENEKKQWAIKKRGKEEEREKEKIIITPRKIMMEKRKKGIEDEKERNEVYGGEERCGKTRKKRKIEREEENTIIKESTRKRRGSKMEERSKSNRPRSKWMEIGDTGKRSIGRGAECKLGVSRLSIVIKKEKAIS